jgi:dTMP kinase
LSKALFIVFEGIDGSGTTTQCQLLAEKIKNLGLPVIRTREPGGTPLAESIRDLVLDPNATGLTAVAELLLYAASRVQHVNEKIKPALEQGIHVVCDRFTASTWAYQGYGRSLDLDLIEKITKIAEAGCEPDLTIYLRVSLEVAKERRIRRGQNPDRVEMEEEGFQRRVAAGYEQVAQMGGSRVLVLDGGRRPEEVACEVWQGLLQRWPWFQAIGNPS